MATQYREESVTGTKYQRAFRVEFENPLNKIPSATFHEEQVAILSDGSTVTKLVGAVSGTLADPNITFDMVNPETLEPLGSTMTYAELYTILVSLYISLATTRDNQLPPV